jgi:1-acyl-sn-glycerol-3-phosphate acyltransferase
MAGHTPIPTRLLRLTLVTLHLLRGLAVAAAIFPWISEEKRDLRKRRWSRKLLSILSVSVRERNAPENLPERCLLVLNHISWVDIFVINARSPATFIAKAEIRDWPVVGWLCTLVGTLYIERGRHSAARKASRRIGEALGRGVLIAIFPEGTTTFGRTLEPFHAALFQPALDAAAGVQPIALRYLDRAGNQTDAAGYVGETSFVESVWTIVSTPHIVAELNFLPAVPAHRHTRRSLAERTEGAIAAALGVTAPERPHARRRAPGTGADHPGE